MSLVEYGRILLRRGWIILLLAVIAAGSAYFLSQRQTPIYRATQKVLFVPSRSDFGLTEASRLLLNNNVEYLNSTFVAQQVVDNLSLDMTAGQLLGETTITANRDSLFIQIDVDNPDPRVAERVALEWGNLLVQYRDALNQEARREDRITARIQDNPTSSLESPRPAINAAAGAVLGILLGGVIVFVLEYLESSVVRRREDLERALELPVLAIIPTTEG